MTKGALHFRPRLRRRRWFCILATTLGALCTSVPGDAAATTVRTIDAREVIGMGIYRSGKLPDGQLLRATVQGDVTISGDAARCSGCHGQSGLGYAEGSEVPLAVSGAALFEPRKIEHSGLPYSRFKGPGTRPAYTAETLARAIRSGLDAAGEPLNALMPRYEIEGEALQSLIAYLKTLSSTPAPGLTDTEIHFATVVTDGVDTTRRDAMLDVLRNFFNDKNSGTRLEVERARYRAVHKEWDYRAYRKWKLHVWELSGPGDTWRDQLDALYRDQPVFALVSGIASGSWQPVHGFCQQREVPCILPNTSLPVIAEGEFYSIYYSEGVALEANVLAKYLGEESASNSGKMPELRVLQVHRGDERGGTAAAALAQALAASESVELRTLPIEHSQEIAAEIQDAISTADDSDVLVLWLDENDLAPLIASLSNFRGREIYLSSTLSGELHRALPDGLRNRIRLTHPYALSDVASRRLIRTKAWLSKKGVALTDARLQANTFFAVRVLGDALMHISGNFVRDYLVEKIEHRMASAAPASMYPSPSLAAGQRFVSRGAYIAIPSQDKGGGLTALSDWIIP